MYQSTMSTKLSLGPLVLLCLCHVAADITDTSGDGVIELQNIEENRNNTPQAIKSETSTTDMTAGRSLCRANSPCGFNGETYKFCYTDYSDNWDYCCTGNCGYNGENYMWCQSGDKWQYCGEAGFMDIQARSCHYAHQCGMHQETRKESYYWCYVDHSLNWDRCCRPDHTCGQHGQAYKWCYTGYEQGTDWQYCK